MAIDYGNDPNGAIVGLAEYIINGTGAGGAPTDAPVTDPDAAASMIALLKGMISVLQSGVEMTGAVDIGNTPTVTPPAMMVPSASFTRPADTTAYSSGDLVANSTTAGSVTPMQFTVGRIAGGSGMIRRLRLKKSDATLSGASFRLHLYNAAPTPSNGDNGAWLTNGLANYIGSLDVTMDRAFTDGATGTGIPTAGAEVNFLLPSGQIVYGLLEARAAYTPVSGETFTALLEVIPN